jgi:hypothetical protein
MQFPTAKVADCSFDDIRLWANPLVPASNVCQDKDAMNAPTTKRNTLLGDDGEPALNPSMSVVK